MVDPDHLQELLTREFFASEADIAAVVEAAVELDAECSFQSETGHEFRAELIAAKLHDSNRDLIDGWNWWMRELGFLFGGYDQYTVASGHHD